MGFCLFAWPNQVRSRCWVAVLSVSSGLSSYGGVNFSLHWWHLLAATPDVAPHVAQVFLAWLVCLLSPPGISAPIANPVAAPKSIQFVGLNGSSSGETSLQLWLLMVSLDSLILSMSGGSFSIMSQTRCGQSISILGTSNIWMMNPRIGNAVSPTHMHIEILVRFILLFIVSSGPRVALDAGST